MKKRDVLILIIILFSLKDHQIIISCRVEEYFSRFASTAFFTALSISLFLDFSFVRSRSLTIA